MTCDTAGWETRSCAAALLRLPDCTTARTPADRAAQSTSDMVVPIGDLGHKRPLSSLKLNRGYRL